MKLSLMLSYSGAHLDIQVKLIQRAKRLGFYSVLTAGAYRSDAITPLAYLAAVTKRIKQRHRAWGTLGATGLIMWAAQEEAVDVIAEAARLN